MSKCKSFLNLSGSDIYLHRDTNLMPKNPAAWSSWNFLGNVNNKVCLTYWLNVLQVSNYHERFNFELHLIGRLLISEKDLLILQVHRYCLLQVVKDSFQNL